MESLTDAQWERYDDLLQHLERLPVEERQSALRSIRLGCNPDEVQVLDLLECKLSLPPEIPTWLSDVSGDYQFIEFIGRGGMGDVYRVFHRRWQRDMAVKSPRIAGLSHDDRDLLLEYFEREGSAWSDLTKHPNIVTCFYVRKIGAVPRVFSEYVDGVTLQKFICTDGIDLRSALDIGIQICEGMAHAARTVVHRDLKPSNILVNGSGLVKISDFGLCWKRGKVTTARVTTAAPPNCKGTQTFIEGTLPYRSPEHGTEYGRDTLADIWSFAIVFWEMMTLDRPADGVDADQFIRAGLAKRCVPDSLSEALLACVSFRSQRIQSFEHLKDRLLAVYSEVEGEQHPRSSPRIAQLLPADGNNRALSQLDLNNEAGAVEHWEECLKLDPGFLPAVFNYGLFRWRKGAISDADLVDALGTLTQDERSGGYVDFLLALIHLARGDPDQAQSHLSRVPHSSVDRPEFESVQGILAFNLGNFGAALQFFQSALHESPGRVQDRFHLACCYSKLGDFDKAEELVSHHGNVAGDISSKVSAAEPFRIAYHGAVSIPGFVRAIAFDFGNRLLVGTNHGLAGLVDLDSSKPVFWLRRRFKEPIRCISCPSDGRVLTSHDEGALRLWNVMRQDGQVVLRQGGEVSCGGGTFDRFHGDVVVGSDGTLALSAEQAGYTIWDLEECRVDEHIKCSQDCKGVAFGASPEIVLGLDGGGAMVEHNLDNGETRRVDISDGADSMVVSADGKRAYLSCRRETICWDTERATEIGQRLPVWEPYVVRDRNNDWILAESQKGTSLVNASSGIIVHTLQMSDNRCSASLSADLSRDLTWIAVEDTNVIRLWHLSGVDSPHVAPDVPYLLSEPQSASESIDALTGFEGYMSKVNKEMADGCWSCAYGTVRKAQKVPGYERNPAVLKAISLLAVQGKRVRLRDVWKSTSLEGHSAHLRSVQFHPRPGSQLAISGSFDGTARIWDLEKGWPVFVSPPLAPIVGAVALTWDDRALIGAGGSLVEYDLASGSLVRIRDRGQEQGPVFWTLSSDGAAVRVNEVGHVECWDSTERKCKWQARTAVPTSLAIGPNTKSVVCAGEKSNVLCVRDLFDGTLLDERNLMDGRALRHLKFSPVGSCVAIVDDEGSVAMWDWESRRLCQVFDSRLLLPYPLAVSRDGDWVVSGSGTDLFLWSVGARKHVSVLKGHAGEIVTVDVSRDGRWALSGAFAGELFLWEFDWELDLSAQ